MPHAPRCAARRIHQKRFLNLQKLPRQPLRLSSGEARVDFSVSSRAGSGHWSGASRLRQDFRFRVRGDLLPPKLLDDLVKQMIRFGRLMIHAYVRLFGFSLYWVEVRERLAQPLTRSMHQHADRVCTDSQMLADFLLTHFFDAL